MQLDDEIEIVRSMFSDDVNSCTQDADSLCLQCGLPNGMKVEIRVPRNDYPTRQRPRVKVLQCSYGVSSAAFEKNACSQIAALPLGFPMLVCIMQTLVADEEFPAVVEEASKANPLHQDSPASREREPPVGNDDFVKISHHGIELMPGNPITDQRSKFLAHVARVSSTDQVAQVLQVLRSDKRIASATHPTIFAYRFTDSHGRLQADCDDDGEHGASKKLLFVLEQRKVDGWIAVVTRWFGGTLLGPVRFKHICSCAMQALELHGCSHK